MYNFADYFFTDTDPVTNTVLYIGVIVFLFVIYFGIAKILSIIATLFFKVFATVFAKNSTLKEALLDPNCLRILEKYIFVSISLFTPLVGLIASNLFKIEALYYLYEDLKLLDFGPEFVIGLIIFISMALSTVVSYILFSKKFSDKVKN